MQTLNQEKNPALLNLPLIVYFDGETAVDYGGVTREFFHIVLKQILNPCYGMFIETENHQLWFDRKNIASFQEYKLIGMLIGLAAFNRVLLDLRFPLLLYSLLAGKKPTTKLLKEAFPTISRSIEKILEYSGADFEEVFNLDFSVDYDYFGELRNDELKFNGRQIPVTESNRREFVELFTSYMGLVSIQKQFAAFFEGFSLACNGAAFELFRAEELESFICGDTASSAMDLQDLRQSTTYKSGFHDNHPFIQMFWRVLASFPMNLRKRFLFFTTGSDRVPLGGLNEINLIIERSGSDSEMLPTSHTCFSWLLIPEYSTEQKLVERLTTALEHAEGFGFV
ncbi:o ubiquitin protein ligase E3A [Pelomyxa schiedti]|nr:o ubiquitin protein ligase E3A [Pelomyxa schiedti]